MKRKNQFWHERLLNEPKELRKPGIKSSKQSYD